MTPNPVPHLCGGILFDLLLEARKPRQKARNKLNGGSDGLTIPGVYAGLIYIVTGEDFSSVAGTTLNKCATNFKKCDDSTGDYVPFTKAATRSAFQNLYQTNKPCLLKRTAGFIERYLNKDKCVWLVSALIETMQKDTSVDGETLIAVSHSDCIPVKQLHEAQQIMLLPFLLSVINYVICNCPDCESGKATFTAWYSQAGSNTEWKFNSDIGSVISAINIDTDLSVPTTDASLLNPADATQEEPTDREVIDNAILNTGRIMAEVFGAAEHQLAEQIRRNNKKADSSEDESDSAEAEVVDGEDPSGAATVDKKVVHQTIVNQYGDHPVHIDHVENLKL
ncbi:MAG: hypothetical protein IKH56_08755 [Oscillospiraceae bacterium]|nr:hypothetical protein [Oscillospiraceae bacterium]